ncbi:hypothetical protein QUA23_14450 [Microcoleus sp. Pol1C5]
MVKQFYRRSRDGLAGNEVPLLPTTDNSKSFGEEIHIQVLGSDSPPTSAVNKSPIGRESLRIKTNVCSG